MHVMRSFVSLFLILSFVRGVGHDNPRIVTPHVDPSLRFSENLGQWDQNILFRTQLDGGLMFLEKNCLTFNFYDKKKFRAIHHGGIMKGRYKDTDIMNHAYRITFLGCSPSPAVERLQPGTDYENFFIGNDPSKWKSFVKNYHQVWLRGLYNNIDYEVITAISGLKYNFHVKPGGDPSSIRLKYDGVDKLRVEDGVIRIKLAVNDVMEQRPYAYQLIDGNVREVVCRYRVENNILSFEFPAGYDHNVPLVIDPLLVFAAQSGSTADNFGMTATYDPQGNLYSGGTAYSNGYPTTLGAFSNSFNGSTAYGRTDVVITKYNSTGNALLYSTYVGGGNTEVISSMIVDASGDLCFYGATGSADFPVTSGAYDVTFNGGNYLSFVNNGTNYSNGTDIYVGKLNPSGSTLLGCTYIGGNGNDGVNHVNHLTNIGQNLYEYVTDSLQWNYGDQYRGEIQLDANNNIYIASSTRSSNFPTVNGFDNTLGGKQDAVIVKFNPSLTTVLYSTYLGGSSNECGNSLIVNTQGEVFVTGGTCSQDFPATSGVFSPSYNGGIADGYIAQINAAGNAILRATFVGTGFYDQTYFIQKDKYNNIFVYGQSLGNMPVVNAGTVVPYSNPGTHQFVRRFNSTLTNVNMSTVFGSNTSDIDISPSAFAVDKCNNIYLSGWGGNILGGPPISGMPLFQPTQSSTTGYDFYFMGLDSNASAIKYGSYFGGGTSQEHVDGGTSRFDPGGRIYQSVCAGCWGNDDFPVTPGAWPGTPGNPNHSTLCNNGVVKLDFQILLTVATINTNTLSGCAPLAMTFTNANPGTPGSTFKWYLGNGVTNSVTVNPTMTYTAPGIYTVALVIRDNLTCNKIDSTISLITVLPGPSVNFTATSPPCSRTVTLNYNGNAQSYSWNYGDGGGVNSFQPTYTYTNDGIYTISVTAINLLGCTVTKTHTVSVLEFNPAAAGSGSICRGASLQLQASGGTDYSWLPGTGLSGTNVPSPMASPASDVVYTVNVTNTSFGQSCSRSFTLPVSVKPQPTADFSYTVHPCGGMVFFEDHSKDGITSWLWSFDASGTSTITNPYYFFPAGGAQNVTLTATNAYGCAARITKPLNVTTVPVAVKGATNICIGQSNTLEATGGIQYAWYPSAGLDNPSIANPVATPTITTEYNVVITTAQANSVTGAPCEYTLGVMVKVSELTKKSPAAADATPTLVIKGESSTLIYTGDPGAYVTWLPDGGTNPGTGYTVTATPDKPTTYTAAVVHEACRGTVYVFVDVRSNLCNQGEIFIPNTFTPNGDGKNDVFRVRGISVDEVYFAVYNRWGEMVYETHSKDEGWDGRYKGRDADVGVFGWYLKVKCFNGEETFLKGNVTLVR